MNEDTHQQIQVSTQRRDTWIIIALVVILIIIEFVGNYSTIFTPIEGLELAANDSAFRLRGEQAPNENIVIVAIDDESLSWIKERWPWPRTYFADIVNWLDDAGAKVIAIDMFLFDESLNLDNEDVKISDALGNTCTANIQQGRGACDLESAKNNNISFEIIGDDDLALAEALAGPAKTVAVNQIYQANQRASTTNELPLPIFLEHLDGYGISEVERDDDAIARGIRAYKEYQDEVYYNWAFEIVRLYLDIDPPSDPSPAGVNFNGSYVPLNNQNKLLINFVGPSGSFPIYPAAFVPLGDYSPEEFKDKIVFIGATSETLQDIYPTPFSSSQLTAGVEVVANAVATLLSGDFIRTVPPWVTLLIIAVMAFASWLISKIEAPTVSIIIAGGIMLVYFIIRQIVFTQSGWLIGLISPLLMIFLGVVIPTLDQAVTQEAEKRRVRGLFSQFISPEMVNQLIDTQDIDSLNKRTELTILFSDIRSFTTISEKLTPEGVVSLLNPYLEVMSEIIHKHGGTVDKYEGDAIVAFFGEPIPYPDHAVRAARASLEMRGALKELTQGWRSEGKFMDVFEMGVGLNTGEVFVGMIGSKERINYTIIGDAANLAARLQDQTKEYNCPILISGETWKHIQHEFISEYADSKLLKGKTEPVDIYKLVSSKVDPTLTI